MIDTSASSTKTPLVKTVVKLVELVRNELSELFGCFVIIKIPLSSLPFAANISISNRSAIMIQLLNSWRLERSPDIA